MKIGPSSRYVKHLCCCFTFGFFLLAVDSSTPKAVAEYEAVMKIATIVPQSADAARHAKKGIRDLEQRTQGRVTARVYFSGAAGDEKTVLRKMRAGQIDATFLGLDMIRNFVPQVMVMAAPQTYTTYQQVDAIRRVFSREFNDIAYKNGFKILAWGDAGLVRILSKDKVQLLRDFRRAKPWVYEHSPLLKEFYRILGCKGVPLGLMDVYSAIQIGTIDLVWGSAIVAVLMRWHSKARFISPPTGLLQGAMVITRRFWERLNNRDRKAIEDMVDEQRKKIQDKVRDLDNVMYKKLLKRGISFAPFKKMEDWLRVGRRLRDSMVGRLYSRELLTRMERIIERYPDKSKKADSHR